MCRCGGTFIDTADVYSRGASEEIVGRWLKRQRRDDLVIMTKVRSGTRIEIAEEQGWSKFWSVYNNEHTWNLLDALFAVAEEMGKTPAQLAINWLLQRPGVPHR
jgi:aryl-alcohol dehydrogenase-like predicted oxidoreductase